MDYLVTVKLNYKRITAEIPEKPVQLRERTFYDFPFSLCSGHGSELYTKALCLAGAPASPGEGLLVLDVG